MQSGAAWGLSALYAYEAQIPQIVAFKKDALRKHYLKTEAERAGLVEFPRCHADVGLRKSCSGSDRDSVAAHEICRELATRSKILRASKCWRFLRSMSPRLSCQTGHQQIGTAPITTRPLELAFWLGDRIKELEMELGRRPAPQWSLRIIDVDILDWGLTPVASNLVTLPHEDLETRPFALLPYGEWVWRG